MLKKNQKRIEGRIRTYRKNISTINKRLKQSGYLYDKHRRSWVIAIRKNWDAILTSDQKSRTLRSIKDHAEVEEHIRDSIFKSIDRVNRKLSNLLPIAYDEKNDIWVANDYTSRKSGKNIPIEIKIKYDPDEASYEVESYQWRGDEKSGKLLEKTLNGR